MKRAEATQTTIQEDYRPVDGVSVECSWCSHTVESFGMGEASIKRCLVLMQEECPKDENNFYVHEDGD